MRRYGSWFAVTVVLLVVMTQGAFANDYWRLWDGHWERNTSGTTTQAWEFPTSPGPTPSTSGNPYGVAQLTLSGASFGHATGPQGPTLGDVPVWHFDQDGGMTIRIPNSQVLNPMKLIYVQITSDHYTLNNADPTTDPGASSIGSPGPIIQHPTGTWYTYNWLIKIEPNPSFETINFVFPESTNIEEVVVDTICTTVPEPASLMVLGVGLGSLLLRRRRR